MRNMWNVDGGEDEPPYANEPLGRVVPADGDPEVEHYRASLRAQERPRVGMRWLRGRHALRNVAFALAAVALVVLFIKPLAVVAAVVAAVILGLIVLGLLVVGALVLAARLALGGRVAYHAGHPGAYRRTGRWR